MSNMTALDYIVSFFVHVFAYTGYVWFLEFKASHRTQSWVEHVIYLSQLG